MVIITKTKAKPDTALKNRNVISEKLPPFESKKIKNEIRTIDSDLKYFDLTIIKKK